MKLKVIKSTKNKIITVELETIDFSESEMQMLDQLGEPIIDMEKNYGGNTVKFSKRIRTGFKVKVRFDATLEQDTYITTGYIEKFLEAVQDQIELKMGQLLDQYNIELIPSETILDIKY